MKFDFIVSNEGSVFLLTPVSEAARTWAGKHLPQDAQAFGPATVIELHDMSGIIVRIRAGGLEIALGKRAGFRRLA